MEIATEDTTKEINTLEENDQKVLIEAFAHMLLLHTKKMNTHEAWVTYGVWCKAPWGGRAKCLGHDTENTWCWQFIPGWWVNQIQKDVKRICKELKIL